MLLLWVIIAAILVPMAVAWGLRRSRKGMETEFRHHFPRIARLRLIAACPGLDGVLQETDLRMLFDWILLQLYGRTRTSGFDELVQWTMSRAGGESLELVSLVTRQAVDRLPSPVLAVIDGCEGRTVAGVIIDQALAESSERIRSSRNP